MLSVAGEMTASVRDSSLHQVRTSSRCLCMHFLSVAIHFAHIFSAIYTKMILSYVYCALLKAAFDSCAPLTAFARSSVITSSCCLRDSNSNFISRRAKNLDGPAPKLQRVHRSLLSSRAMQPAQHLEPLELLQRSLCFREMGSSLLRWKCDSFAKPFVQIISFVNIRQIREPPNFVVLKKVSKKILSLILF